MSLVAFALLILFTSCGDRSARRTLLLTGSSTVAPLAAEIGRRFEAVNPGVRIDVQSGGSSRGVTDVRAGLATIGMVSRALRSDESDLASRRVALDAIVLVAHRSLPLEGLTRRQVLDVFTGKVTDWKSLGGPDGPITVVHKAEGRSTNELFLQHFGLKNSEVRAHVIIGDNAQGLLTVAGNPLAIGYVSFGAALFESEAGRPVKILSLDGEFPDPPNISNGTFAMTRPLLLVTLPAPDPLVSRFLDFAASAAVDDLIQAQQFVPPSR